MSSEKEKNYLELLKSIEELSQNCVDDALFVAEIFEVKLEQLDLYLESNSITEEEAIDKLKEYLATTQKTIEERINAVVGYLAFLVDIGESEFGKTKELEEIQLNVFLNLGKLGMLQEISQELFENMITQIK